MQNNRKQVDLEAVHTLLSFSRMACRQAGDQFPSKETTISSLLSDSETWNDTQSKFHFHSAKVSNSATHSLLYRPLETNRKMHKLKLDEILIE